MEFYKVLQSRLRQLKSLYWPHLRHAPKRPGLHSPDWTVNKSWWFICSGSRAQVWGSRGATCTMHIAFSLTGRRDEGWRDKRKNKPGGRATGRRGRWSGLACAKCCISPLWDCPEWDWWEEGTPAGGGKMRLVCGSWGGDRRRRGRERRALRGRWRSGDDKQPHYSHLNVSGWTSAHLFCGRLKCCPTGSDLFASAALIESDDKQHKTVNLQACARSCARRGCCQRGTECAAACWCSGFPFLFVTASIYLSIKCFPYPFVYPCSLLLF